MSVDKNSNCEENDNGWAECEFIFSKADLDLQVKGLDTQSKIIDTQHPRKPSGKIWRSNEESWLLVLLATMLLRVWSSAEIGLWPHSCGHLHFKLPSQKLMYRQFDLLHLISRNRAVDQQSPMDSDHSIRYNAAFSLTCVKFVWLCSVHKTKTYPTSLLLLINKVIIKSRLHDGIEPSMASRSQEKMKINGNQCENFPLARIGPHKKKACFCFWISIISATRRHCRSASGQCLSPIIFIDITNNYSIRNSEQGMFTYDYTMFGSNYYFSGN